MNILLFLLQYFLAVVYIWVPENMVLYYIVGICLILFMKYYRIRTVNVFRDVHPLLIGYGTVWLVEVLPIGHIQGLFLTLIVLSYNFFMFSANRQKQKNATLRTRVKSKPQIGEAILHTFILPFSIFFVCLYVSDNKEMAFLLYCAWVLYGLKQMAFFLKSRLAQLICGATLSLVTLQVYAFSSFSLGEKIVFLCVVLVAIFSCGTEKTKKETVKRSKNKATTMYSRGS